MDRIHDLQDHHQASCAFEHLLIGDMRECLGEPQTIENRQSLLLILDALVGHISVDSPEVRGGSLVPSPLKGFSHWRRKSNTVSDARAACALELTALRTSVKLGGTFIAITSGMVRSLRRWIRSFLKMRQNEFCLVQDTFLIAYEGEA